MIMMPCRFLRAIRQLTRPCVWISLAAHQIWGPEFGSGLVTMTSLVNNGGSPLSLAVTTSKLAYQTLLHALILQARIPTMVVQCKFGIATVSSHSSGCSSRTLGTLFMLQTPASAWMCQDLRSQRATSCGSGIVMEVMAKNLVRTVIHTAFLQLQVLMPACALMFQEVQPRMVRRCGCGIAMVDQISDGGFQIIRMRMRAMALQQNTGSRRLKHNVKCLISIPFDSVCTLVHLCAQQRREFPLMKS